MAGTIFVDTDNLPGIISSLTTIQQAIDGYKTTLGTLSGQLNQTLVGTAPIIATVENSFVTTITTVATVDTSLATLIGQLNKVQADAQAAIAAL